MFNVLIRPLAETDAFISWNWRNDPEVWRYTGRKPDQYITYEIEKIWIEKALSDNTSRRFAILVNGEYVGNIQLTNIEEDKTAEYHIFIGNKNYWGNSVAVMATHQIIRYAKTVLNLEEIYLNVNPNNVPAIKVFERCNFTPVNKKIKMILNLSKKNFPKVSIFMMVYNHEKYIKEALNGVLMQKCNFDYEIVIGEDCSTDKSRNIILEYSKQFPGKFKLLLHKSNIGAQKNQLAVFDNCTGQYIAMCEGDDYWTDPLKLQKQVDFLEANPDCFLCHSDVNTLDVDGKLERNNSSKLWNYKNEYSDYRFSIFYPTAHTCTAVLRNIDALRRIHKKCLSGDWMLFILLTLKGDAKFINEQLAVYRTGVGVSNHIIWHDNFGYRSLFLLDQLSLRISFKKNYWLLRGAIYFILIYISKKLDVYLFTRIANRFKIKMN